MAFVVFCVLASGAYCINDVIDFKRDREHPKKKNRPIASGALSRSTGLVVGIALVLLALLLTLHLSSYFQLVIVIYIFLQILYSLFLKGIAILDILVLSLSIMLRVLGGVAATAIDPSPWILVFSWLLALMLAVGKRYLELGSRGKAAKLSRPVLSFYSTRYLGHLMSSLGAVTFVCYLLWCNEVSAAGRFSKLGIYPSSLFVTYGLFRYQLLVFHRVFDEDPVKGLLVDGPIMASIFAFILYLSALMYY